jgi:hypothetical protein
MGRNETMLLAILALFAAIGTSFVTVMLWGAGVGFPHGGGSVPNMTPFMSLIAAGTGWVVWKVRRNEHDPNALRIAVVAFLVSAAVLVWVILVSK